MVVTPGTPNPSPKHKIVRLIWEADDPVVWVCWPEMEGERCYCPNIQDLDSDSESGWFRKILRWVLRTRGR